MRNLMYDMENGKTAVYIGKGCGELSCLASNISALSEEDMKILYMEDGYANFYCEKELIANGTGEFSTQCGKATYSHDRDEYIEKIHGSAIVRLSPFIQRTEITSYDDFMLDCRTAWYRHITIKNVSGRCKIRLHSVTEGSSLDFMIPWNSDEEVDMYVEGADLNALCRFTSSSGIVVHISELENNEKFLIDRHIHIAQLGVACEGTFDMMALSLNDLTVSNIIMLCCGGYANVPRWLEHYSSIASGLCITADSRDFLSELLALERTEIIGKRENTTYWVRLNCEMEEFEAEYAMPESGTRFQIKSERDAKKHCQCIYITVLMTT